MAITPDSALLDDLAGRISGRVLRPADDGYDAARRVHNGLVDRTPAVIIRCRSAADVAAGVRFARAAGLDITVRGGGHNVAGRAVADDAVMIDLAEMKGTEVDAEARTVRAEGGLTWAELNGATAEHGLAVTGGVISSTGIAGLTLGGGLGWLMAKHGLAADNLLGRRARQRRRRGARCDRDIRPRPLLGATRRRRQLRDRDHLHLPAASAGDGHGRVDRPPGRRRARPPPLLPRRRRERLRRPDRVRRARARSGRVGHEDLCPGRVPRRRPRAGRAGPRAVQELGLAADRRGRADALPRDEHAPRRGLPGRVAELLAVELHAWSP